MATTIRSTALDFNNIKSNLKTFFENKEEFKDYNFEASGLNNILDVLAYNTHINGLIANFALNESYLPTAQLRSSMVSLAEGIGYIPDTDASSIGTVRLTFNSTAAGRASKVSLPAYTKFNTTVDDISYVFQTIEPFEATDNGSGFYEFKTSDGLNRIPISEGTLKTKTFLVGEYEDNPVYIIPDTTLNSESVTVKVFDSTTSTQSTTFQNITKATSLSANSTVYILKESPNGFFELSFGDGSTFGIAPSAGNRIELQYLSTKGAAANGASVFTPQATFNSGTISATLNVTTFINSAGGKDKESIESMRQNAPFQYATQNRMVTAADYSAMILKNYGGLISDITSWGGQDNALQEFGAVYVSILFEDSVSDDTISATKLGILDLAAQLAVVSFNLRFVDPVTTFVEVDTFFQFNPKLTDLTVNAVQANVDTTVANYFSNNTGKFDQSFRRSNMLSLIDESSTAILSSRANVRMQQRFAPSVPNLIATIKSLLTSPGTVTTTQLDKIVSFVTNKAYNDAATYMQNNNLSSNSTTFNINKLSLAVNRISQTLQFPASIAVPDNDTFIVTSTEFTFNSQLCLIKNLLNSNTLQIVTAAGGVVITDNIGSYNANDGTVTIQFFNPTALSGGETQLKLSVVPANQSVLAPVRNDRFVFDPTLSVTTPVTTDAAN
tara:strand:- start:24916 stop:26922 length:2007 start_codon:yes stop_codon:yes gene_type:complete